MRRHLTERTQTNIDYRTLRLIGSAKLVWIFNNLQFIEDSKREIGNLFSKALCRRRISMKVGLRRGNTLLVCP